MAPKKKGNKKGQDDWEAELGESIAPAAAEPAADADAAGDDAAAAAEEPAAGGLMGLMRKNKEKRKKKGLSEDYEDVIEAAEPAEDLTAKVAVEATMDDEFALPEKGKGKGKGKQQPAKGGAAAKAADGAADDSGRILTKAEKEKLKKEQEKQRKKEQVGNLSARPFPRHDAKLTVSVSLGCQEEEVHSGPDQA